MTVSAPLWTNDPYFAGFSASGTFHALPYAETAGVPGQWDMHAIQLEYAFAYSQANSSGKVNANALGSSAVKLAIIDTGQDTLHPELAGKVVYQHCFITDPHNVASSSSFSTDGDGHGTDVSGIAAANTNNALGFVGAGGNVSLMAYRVFPTPDDTCLGNSPDSRCSASTADIASAIVDAVSNGAKVISMSLGGGGCTAHAGVDDDPVEQNAVAEALAANVIVVVASGNDNASSLSAPACISGVLAVGATGLADGSVDGTHSTGHTIGTTASPVEYVASYSNASSTGNTFRSASSWGIVAPGGDPVDGNDTDDLHWIENIYTSTPFDANFAGSCSTDFGGGSTTDCRILIAGTSMATPHVAGAAALILSVNASYQSPSAMRSLLCGSADNLNDPRQGCGRVNVYRAMATAIGDPTLP
jgi:subtilisin family serine protease